MTSYRRAHSPRGSAVLPRNDVGGPAPPALRERAPEPSATQLRHTQAPPTARGDATEAQAPPPPAQRADVTRRPWAEARAGCKDGAVPSEGRWRAGRGSWAGTGRARCAAGRLAMSDSRAPGPEAGATRAEPAGAALSVDVAGLLAQLARSFALLLPVYALGYLGLSFSWVLLALALLAWCRRSRGLKATRLCRALALLEDEERAVRLGVRACDLPAWVSARGPRPLTCPPPRDPPRPGAARRRRARLSESGVRASAAARSHRLPADPLPTGALPASPPAPSRQMLTHSEARGAWEPAGRRPGAGPPAPPRAQRPPGGAAEAPGLSFPGRRSRRGCFRRLRGGAASRGAAGTEITASLLNFLGVS